MDIISLTAVELGKKIKAGEITVADAVEACHCTDRTRRRGCIIVLCGLIKKAHMKTCRRSTEE